MVVQTNQLFSYPVEILDILRSIVPAHMRKEYAGREQEVIMEVRTNSIEVEFHIQLEGSHHMHSVRSIEDPFTPTILFRSLEIEGSGNLYHLWFYSSVDYQFMSGCLSIYIPEEVQYGNKD